MNTNDTQSHKLVTEAIAAAGLARLVKNGMPLGFMGAERTVRIRTVNRYAPCPCGSGKKFKFCCGVNRHEQAQKERLDVQSSS